MDQDRLNEIIREEIQNIQGHSEILTMNDLVDYVERINTGFPKEGILRTFTDEYRKEGFNGLERLFFSATKQHLKDMGSGRFAIDYTKDQPTYGRTPAGQMRVESKI